jgi:preprotein translocase subunit SecB
MQNISTTETENATSSASPAQPVFVIQRIYTKDRSFEVPDAPEIFKKNWNPDLKLHIQTRNAAIDPDMYEVVLQVTITVESEGETAFLAEVHQAGIFTLQNFADEDLPRLLGQTCPHILYPYLRSVVATMVNDASFPPLHLAPINFEALYERQLAQKQQN